jgi:hypothetical protein
MDADETQIWLTRIDANSNTLEIPMGLNQLARCWDVACPARTYAWKTSHKIIPSPQVSSLAGAGEDVRRTGEG